MTTCPTQSILQSYLDGELCAVEAEPVERHLDVCPVCRRQAASMRAVHSILSTTDPASPPEGLLDRVHDAVATRGEGLACEQVHELVVLALDREIGPEQLVQLQTHLAGCPDCRFWAERTGRLVGGLRRVEAVAPPAGLRERVETAVEKVAARGSMTLHRLLPHDLRRRVAALAGLAAAAAIMFAVVFRFAGAPAPTETAVYTPGEVFTEAPAPDAIAETPSIQPDAAVDSATPVEKPAAEAVRPARTARPRHQASDARSAPTATPPRSSQVASAVTSPPRDVRAVSSDAVAATRPTAPADKPAVDSSAAVSVPHLVNARPVAVARRTEVSGPAAVPPRTTTSDPAHAILTRPLRTTVVSEPRTPSTPVSDGATLAKASPRTPPSLRAAETLSSEPTTTRLASVSSEGWLPVHDPTRSVYTSPAPSPSRLATASERISREVDAMKPGSSNHAIVVIK